MPSRVQVFTRAAKDTFDTPSGRKILAYLKNSYVDNICLCQTDRETFYRLGQKELIQSLIRYVKEPDQLDEIIIKSAISEDD